MQQRRKKAFPTNKELFSNADLKKLIWPLVLEQVLSITVGLADTIMVSSVGEAAVSGVSLVDMLNVLIINIFSALATGGAVVVAQLLGARDRKRACDASRQLYLVVIAISLGMAVLVMLLRTPLLRLLFGSIEDDVMDSALTYLTVSVFSYPVLAVYNAGAALFRAQGNSRISMLIAGLINIINLIGNSVLIFVLDWGVAGAALSSVFSRGVAAVVITVLLLHPGHTVTLRTGTRFRPDFSLIRRILQIGVPNGLENSLFQLGRILVVSIIALFGTTQIAANAVANNLDAVAVIPGQAMSLAMITVIGQCIGAGDTAQARYMAKKLLKITYIINGACCLLTMAATPLVLRIYSLSPEALSLGMTLIFIHNGCAALIWPASFTLPNVLRAANDVRYPMICSVASMMLLRLASGYVLAVMFGLGAIGIWIAMVGDWLCRTICFALRFHGTRWLRFAPGVQLITQSK
nr:MATE family efflux transporter [uncultured Agathobaculum sp.]